jgi:hypothetical protein
MTRWKLNNENLVPAVTEVEEEKTIEEREKRRKRGKTKWNERFVCLKF